MTPCSRSKSHICRGDRLTSNGTTTARPPLSSGPHSSHTEKSNANEWNTVHTSSTPNSNISFAASNSATALACDTATPLGRPVEPEV